MAFTLGPSIERINTLRPFDLPVGKWFLFSLSQALASGCIAVGKVMCSEETKKYIPYAVGGGLAALVKKVPMVRNFLGDTLAEVIAIASGVEMVNDPAGLKLNTRVREAVADAAEALNLITADERKTIVAGPPLGRSFAGSALGRSPVMEIPSLAFPNMDMAALSMAAPMSSPMGSIPAGPGYSEVARRVSAIRL